MERLSEHSLRSAPEGHLALHIKLGAGVGQWLKTDNKQLKIKYNERLIWSDYSLESSSLTASIASMRPRRISTGLAP